MTQKSQEKRDGDKEFRRKFTDGPFKGLVFRKLLISGDEEHWILEFFQGHCVTVTKKEYNNWPEKDCVSNR